MDLSREDAEFTDFVLRYRKRAEAAPTPATFYAYDAARLVIQAIESAGLNRARIRDQLAGNSLNGITGKIRFDSLRGNPAPPVLLTLKNGRWYRQP
jgi:branched-chain amino acid transport system substrate-binding protein